MMWPYLAGLFAAGTALCLTLGTLLFLAHAGQPSSSTPVSQQSDVTLSGGRD